MKKVLIVASVASMIDQFNMNNIVLLMEMGYGVDVACNFEEGNTCSKERIEQLKKKLESMNVGAFQVDFSRSILRVWEHVKAYKQLKQIMKTTSYEFMHCHSPIGGALGRIASHKCKLKAIYTAHGFHFYKGAPVQNWCIFYPIEKFLSKWTDVLITINHEDRARASKFHAKKVEYIPGVGIEVAHDTVQPTDALREEFQIPKDACVMLSVGELNKNKNHEVVIRALSTVKNDKIHYVICGIGGLKEYLENLAKSCGVEKRVHFAGFRTDIQGFYEMADIFVFPSYREGLSVSLMEAISFGLPIICSKIRGNTDLVQEGKGGYLAAPADEAAIAEYIEKLVSDKGLAEAMREYNLENCKNYSTDKVQKEMKRIYQEIS